ncbi:MAG: hypothetical protein HZC24_09640, partial [Rhodocyclales bacterium]|nr:hypothetical protein [Rhodocyclales bacterium]
MITPLWDGGTLTLDLGNGDSVAVGSLTDVAIQIVRFDDGTSLAMADFLAQKGAIQLAGTDGNDVMATFGNGQSLLGAGGDDQLYGSVRDDTLAGGAGNDLLVGAAGKDTYVYNLGDGADTIVDRNTMWTGEDANTLRFGVGITPDMIAPRMDNDSRVITLDLGNGDSIAIGSVFDLSVQNLQFADGVQLSVGQLVELRGGFTL